jgi:hypothetical protein
MEMVILPKLSRRNMRGHDEDELKRRRKVGNCYDRMSKYLMQSLGTNFTNKVLLQIASGFAVARGLVVDRGAKRSKTALICWFCENCQWLLTSQEVFPIDWQDSSPEFWPTIAAEDGPTTRQEADIWLWD